MYQDSLASINDSIKSSNFGKAIPINCGMNNSRTWETLPDSSKLWRLRIVSVNALSNFLIFDSFFIPNGASFYIYNDSLTQVLGAYTNDQNRNDHRMSLGPIIGNAVRLEYHQPKSVGGASIHASAFIHSFKPVFNKSLFNDFNTSSACHINVKCPEGDNWCNQRRSVALIAGLTGNPSPDQFSKLCTVALITNEKRDGKPYFLTANHCLFDSRDRNQSTMVEDPGDWVYIFNYQSQGCSNQANQPSTSYILSGATIRARNKNSDFLLLELLARPPGNFNSFASGWTNDDGRSNNGVGIHHPDGDVKKISTYDKKLSKGNWGTPIAKVWKVKEWKSGSTEGGSSGSPLYNSNGLIIGQLYGGKAACGNKKMISMEDLTNHGMIKMGLVIN